ncbi:MAG TPA: hypothetical protein VKH37_06965, partial [Ferruginibacter sp.]|nr:hypothetical protein [Ferruginibacter sp.]
KFTNHTDAGVTFFNRISSNVTSGMLIASNEFDGNGRATFLSRVNNTSFQSNYCHNSTLATSADLRLFGGVTNFIASNNSFVDGGNDVHAVRLSGGQGANSNVLINENSFVGYAADTAVWILAGGYSGTLNAHCNWWNTTNNGAIAAQTAGAVDYTPWLTNGTDNSPAIGFQPVPNSCNGFPAPALTVTLNGNTLTANNDGNDETASLVVCNVSNNMTFSAISDVNNTVPQSQIKVRQEFVATNSTVCCPDGDFPISAYAGTFSRSANLVTTGSNGKLVIRLRAYNDLNNNNTADPGEPSSDWLIYIVNIDGKAPTLTVPADATVECNQIPPVGIASVSDDLDPNPTVQYLGETRNNNGNCPGYYTLTRTWKATDACGNSVTKSQTITVQDHTPPTITCPAAVAVRCAGDVPAPSPSTVMASDNCSGVTVNWAGDVISGQTCANRYTITRIYVAFDACGNSATCTQAITVNDNVPPTIICPQPVTVKCTGAVPQPSTTAVQAFDNCPGAVTISWVNDVISN